MRMFRLSMAAVAMLSAALPMAGAHAGGNKEAKVAPIGNPAEWFSNDDYPPEARRANQQGTVSITLTVDPTGKAVKCDVDLTSGFPALDSMTCEVALKRSRFTPARTASGQAVASTYRIPGIRWQLTDDGDHPVDVSGGHKVFFKVVTQSKVDTLGLVTACKVVENVGNTPDPCADRLGTKLMPLAKGGKPVSGTVTITSMMTIDPD